MNSPASEVACRCFLLFSLFKPWWNFKFFRCGRCGFYFWASLRALLLQHFPLLPSSSKFLGYFLAFVPKVAWNKRLKTGSVLLTSLLGLFSRRRKLLQSRTGVCFTLWSFVFFSPGLFWWSLCCTTKVEKLCCLLQAVSGSVISEMWKLQELRAQGRWILQDLFGDAHQRHTSLRKMLVFSCVFFDIAMLRLLLQGILLRMQFSRVFPHLFLVLDLCLEKFF